MPCEHRKSPANYTTLSLLLDKAARNRRGFENARNLGGAINHCEKNRFARESLIRESAVAGGTKMVDQMCRFGKSSGIRMPSFSRTACTRVQNRREEERREEESRSQFEFSICQHDFASGMSHRSRGILLKGEIGGRWASNPLLLPLPSFFLRRQLPFTPLLSPLPGIWFLFPGPCF